MSSLDWLIPFSHLSPLKFAIDSSSPESRANKRIAKLNISSYFYDGNVFNSFLRSKSNFVHSNTTSIVLGYFKIVLFLVIDSKSIIFTSKLLD